MLPLKYFLNIFNDLFASLKKGVTFDSTIKRNPFMKPTMANLKRLAAKYDGIVEVDDHDGDAKTIQIVAPDGKQWAEGNCVNMAGPYWIHAPESKAEAIEILMERIEYGLEEFDEELNG